MNWLLTMLRNFRQLTALLAVALILSACNYIPGWDDCADKMDNDNDGLVDAHDPGCVDGGDENLANPETCPTGENPDGTCPDGDVKPEDSESCADQYALAVQTCEDMGESFVDYDCAVADGVITTLSVECSNSQGADNDGDGDVDVTVIVEVVVEGDTNNNENNNGDDTGGGGTDTAAVETDCNDNRDNDGDGDIDYPEDAGCESESDNSEVNSTGSTDCSDGVDNDGDGDTDLDDAGCESASDDSEVNESSDLDERGTMYCDRAFNGTSSSDPVVLFFTDMGYPTNSSGSVVVLLQDQDFDGYSDNFYLTGTIGNSYGQGQGWGLEIFDIDGDGFSDSDLNCVSENNGDPDDIDNDGDCFCESESSCVSSVGSCSALGLDDMDDNAPGNYPGATEACGDGFDNDMDGVVDESCFTDNDGDGYCESVTLCSDGSIIGDCNDNSGAWSPEAPDWAGDGNDNSCDGLDEDANLP